MFLFCLDHQVNIPSDLDELYQLYSRDIDDGQLTHDLKRKRNKRAQECNNIST